MKLFLFALGFACFHSSNKIECGDLLTKYAHKPNGLEYESCSPGTGQTIVEASYRVKGARSKEVEDFLVKNYGMGELKFIGSGWEPTDGKFGEFTSDAIRAFNTNYIMLIHMVGNAEVKGKDGDLVLEKDRKKIPFFYVTVSIMDI